ncbi:hypothetical protein B0H21DRAFT_93835 [Amylocystis lapponica]|nr:hypothetical protein B0H21DRAFT_93835 [Amylocystis lapponica]
MEIDMQSPSFRAARSSCNKAKRPRSPTSPTPLDRPSKRLSLGLGNANNICMPNALTPPLSLATSAYAPVPEDWVVQTRGLRIASPHIAQGQGEGLARVQEVEVERRSDCMDTAMQTDGDVPMAVASPPRVHRSAGVAQPAVSPFIRMPEVPFPASIQLPEIQSQIATPHLPAPDFESATPPVDTMCHVTAASASASTAQGQSQARKPRVTMGPRADCEKCRMGVKGHWMHFD